MGSWGPKCSLSSKNGVVQVVRIVNEYMYWWLSVCHFSDKNTPVALQLLPSQMASSWTGSCGGMMSLNVPGSNTSGAQGEVCCAL